MEEIAFDEGNKRIRVQQPHRDAPPPLPLLCRLLTMEGTTLKPMLLDTQYRMHPGISQFASQQFYGVRIFFYIVTCFGWYREIS